MVLSYAHLPGLLEPNVEVNFARMKLLHALMGYPGLTDFRI